MHTNGTGQFGYLAEAYNRERTFYDFVGWPSLFLDGIDWWTGSSPGDWRSAIVARMARPAPVTITLTGSYDSGTNNGSVTAAFRNDSTASITARVYFVITEDSLYHLDPNGHAWHNHLARDYLPTEIGESVTIAAGATVSKTRTFSINTNWDENKCHIVTWIQRDAPSRDVHQAAEVDVTNLIGIAEYAGPGALRCTVDPVTNPCDARSVRLQLSVPQNTEYRLDFYDIVGRPVASQSGLARSGDEVITNDLTGGTGHLAAGVYLYRFTSDMFATTGKVVVK